VPWLDKVSAFIWEFALNCGNSSRKVIMKSHELHNAVQPLLPQNAHKMLRKIATKRYDRPADLATVSRELLLGLMANADKIIPLLDADADYCDAEAIPLTEFWERKAKANCKWTGL
jgi:hypothetical protein